jgi:hypothetical protein
MSNCENQNVYFSIKFLEVYGGGKDGVICHKFIKISVFSCFYYVTPLC